MSVAHLKGEILGAKWAPIPGWELTHEVSRDGAVRRLDGGHVSIWSVPAGYVQVGLTERGRRPEKRSIHSLVLESFVGPRPNGAVVRHLDGNPSNNAIENLQWGTPAENAEDTIRHGRHRQVAKTHCPQGHPYNAENTRVRKNGHRVCKICDRARCKAYYNRRNKVLRVWQGAQR